MQRKLAVTAFTALLTFGLTLSVLTFAASPTYAGDEGSTDSGQTDGDGTGGGSGQTGDDGTGGGSGQQ